MKKVPAWRNHFHRKDSLGSVDLEVLWLYNQPPFARDGRENAIQNGLIKKNCISWHGAITVKAGEKEKAKEEHTQREMDREKRGQIAN